MKRIITIFFLILMIFIGCIPTPEKAPVIMKEQSQLVEKATRNKKVDLSQLPHLYSYSYKNNQGGYDYSVKVSASIIPLGNQFPIVRVSPADYSQDFVDRLAHCLLANATMYKLDFIRTKAEVMSEIVLFKQKKAAFESIGELSSYDKRLTDLESEYSSAPSEYVPDSISIELQEISVKQNGTTYFYTGLDIGESNLADQPARYLYIRNNWSPTTIRGASLVFCDNREGQFTKRTTNKITQLQSSLQTQIDNHLAMTPELAKKKAQLLLDNLNLPYTIFDILLIEDSSGEQNEP